MTAVVYVANTNVLDLIGLKSVVDNAFVNSATVTVTVKDSALVAVTGQTWPTAMVYVPTSNGNYRAYFENDLALTNKKKYIAVIDADAGVNRIGHWEFPFTAATRTGVP